MNWEALKIIEYLLHYSLNTSHVLIPCGVTFSVPSDSSRLKSSRSTATTRYAINFAKWCNICEFKVIAFFIMQIFCCQLIAFSKLKVLYFTQQCNTKKTYSTEEQIHRSCTFFPGAKKKIANVHLTILLLSVWSLSVQLTHMWVVL